MTGTTVLVALLVLGWLLVTVGVVGTVVGRRAPYVVETRSPDGTVLARDVCATPEDEADAYLRHLCAYGRTADTRVRVR